MTRKAGPSTSAFSTRRVTIPYPLQMADGAGGILVDTVEECAAAILQLLENPGEARELGQRGRERVREHFLLPRLLLNEILLMIELAGTQPILAAASEQRDPVCGMAIEASAPEVRAAYEGRDYRFCSELCHRRFLDSPGRYANNRDANE
jgi:trehalose synthase